MTMGDRIKTDSKCSTNKPTLRQREQQATNARTTVRTPISERQR
jgi:hypothetical protein